MYRGGRGNSRKSPAKQSPKGNRKDFSPKKTTDEERKAEEERQIALAMKLSLQNAPPFIPDDHLHDHQFFQDLEESNKNSNQHAANKSASNRSDSDQDAERIQASRGASQVANVASLPQGM